MTLCPSFYLFLSPLASSVLRGYTLSYCLAQFVRMHTHVPESSNAKNISFYIVNDFVILVDNGSTIEYLPVTQQGFWKSAFRILQQTFLLLQILLMKLYCSLFSTHLIIIDKNAEPLLLSTFRDFYLHAFVAKLSSRAIHSALNSSPESTSPRSNSRSDSSRSDKASSHVCSTGGATFCSSIGAISFSANYFRLLAVSERPWR